MHFDLGPLQFSPQNPKGLHEKSKHQAIHLGGAHVWPAQRAVAEVAAAQGALRTAVTQEQALAARAHPRC